MNFRHFLLLAVTHFDRAAIFWAILDHPDVQGGVKKSRKTGDVIYGRPQGVLFLFGNT